MHIAIGADASFENMTTMQLLYNGHIIYYIITCILFQYFQYRIALA